MIIRLSLDLPEDTTCIRTARVISQCLLKDIKVDRQMIDDVELIVTELSSNVIRHAQSEAAHFLMTLEYYQPKLVITVSDKGQGFDPDNVAPAGTQRPDVGGGLRIGGFGMSLLQGLSDRVEFTASYPHGTTVRVEKMLHYESKQAAEEAAAMDTGGDHPTTTMDSAEHV